MNFIDYNPLAGWLPVIGYALVTIKTSIGLSSAWPRKLIPKDEIVIAGSIWLLILAISIFFNPYLIVDLSVLCLPLITLSIYLGRFYQGFPRLIRLVLMVVPASVIPMGLFIYHLEFNVLVTIKILLILLQLLCIVDLVHRNLVSRAETLSTICSGILCLLIAGGSTKSAELAIGFTLMFMPLALLSVYCSRLYQKFFRPFRIALVLAPIIVISLVFGINENGFNSRGIKLVNQLFQNSRPKSMSDFVVEENRTGELRFNRNHLSMYRTDSRGSFTFKVEGAEFPKLALRAGFKELPTINPDMKHYWLRRSSGIWCELTINTLTQRASGNFCQFPHYDFNSRNRRNAQNISGVYAAARAAGHDFSNAGDGSILTTSRAIIKGYEIPKEPSGPFSEAWFGVPNLDENELYDLVYFLDVEKDGALVYSGELPN